MDMCTFVDHPEDVLPAIKAAGDWDDNAIQYARV
jgi:hypothetical protein